jgi:hypothetical protein
MSDQNLNQNTPSELTPVSTLVELPSSKNNLIEKYKPILIDIFNKIYSKKIVFWLITIFLCIVFLIIISGSIYKNRRTVVIPTSKPTSTPFIMPTPTIIISEDFLSVFQEKLNKLKTQLDELDINQKRLQPPTLNFDVKF